MSEQFETVAKWLDKLYYAEADGKMNNKTGDIVTLGDIVSRDSRVKSCIKCIDDMTDDLLEISDVLEEHQVNVKLENGRYLNPVSAIRSKVDVIWDEVQTIVAWNSRAERTCRIEGRYGNQYCTCCGEMIGTWDPESELYIDGNMVELWNYCPNCGAKVVERTEEGKEK